MRLERSCKDMIEYIDNLTSNALERPSMQTTSLVELEGLLITLEKMRNFCLEIEGQEIADYSEFIQTHKGCTSQGFVLTHSNKTNYDTIVAMHDDKKLHNIFVQNWNEFVEWREKRYQSAGIKY